MARAKYYIQSGFIVKKYTVNPDETNLFSLDKWFKKMLTRYHVAFYDDCCPDDSEFLPARFNNTTGETEYINPATGEYESTADWVAPVTTTTSTVGPVTTTTTTV